MKIVSFIQHFVFVNFNLIVYVRETSCNIQMGDEIFCLVPRRLSLSMLICAQRKAGRRKRASTSLVSPSHGPLRFVTSHWRFASKHLRRKISAHHLVLDRRDKNQYVVAEFYPWFKFYVLLLQNHTPPPPPPTPTNHPPPKKIERRKFQPKIKWNHNKYICQLPFSRHIWAFWNIMQRKKESPTGVTNYFKKALQEKLHKSEKRAGEILFNCFVVLAVFLKRGRAGGEKMRRCHTWPHEEVCYHFSWYILPTS